MEPEPRVQLVPGLEQLQGSVEIAASRRETPARRVGRGQDPGVRAEQLAGESLRIGGQLFESRGRDLVAARAG